MLEFLSHNWGTLLIGLLLLGIVSGIVARKIINKKNGKGGCSCGCGDCPNKGLCHKE